MSDTMAGKLTVEELEKQTAAGHAAVISTEALDQALAEHYRDVTYIDPPQDYMKKTQAAAEAEGD